MSVAELAARASIPERRYVPFLDYPMGDNLRLTVEVARVMHPELSLGAAVRRMGRTSYSTFLSSHAGRVLASTVGRDVEQMLLLSPKVMRLFLNFGEFSAKVSGAQCVHISARNFPLFLESYQVGVIEGVFEHFEVTGSVGIALESISNAQFEARWD